MEVFMNQRATPFFFGVIILMAALGLQKQPGTGTETKPVVRPQSQAREESRKDASEPDVADEKTPARKRWAEPVRLYDEFFGGPAAGDVDEEAALRAAFKKAEGKKTPYDLGFLIALVPDPVDSYLPAQFDHALEGIQSAYANNGYLLDRFWLPWNDPAVKKRQGYRSIPGALLLRRERRLEIVLLVGESPKGGIHKQAFREALALIERAPAASRPKTVRILGPSFSGSAESLRLALHDWVQRPDRPARCEAQQHPPFGFQIVTGSATRKDLDDLFRKESFGIPVCFCRTVLPDDVLRIEAFDFLEKKMGWDLSQVALLVEYDTAYGQGRFLPHDFLVFKFPGGLSGVRTAWEGEREHGSDEGALPVPRSTLDLSLTERGDAADLLPEFSQLSPRSKDLSVENLLRRLRQSNIRYVGIMATDVRDTLFLAERVQAAFPDAVLFAFENDLLYAHPRYSEIMDGMLVLSSFSLFPLGPPKARLGERYRRQFTSESHQGIFRATEYLLNPNWKAEYPEFWIAGVGNGMLWPVGSGRVERARTDWLCSSVNPRPKLTFNVLSDRADPRLLLWSLVLCLLAFWLRSSALPPGVAGSLGSSESSTWLLAVFGAFLLWLGGAILFLLATLPIWVQNIHPPIERAPWREILHGGFGAEVRDRIQDQALYVSVLIAVFAYLSWNLAVSVRPKRRVLSLAWSYGNLLREITVKTIRQAKDRSRRAWLDRVRRFGQLARSYGSLIWQEPHGAGPAPRAPKRRWLVWLLWMVAALAFLVALGLCVHRLWMLGTARYFDLRARQFASGLSPVVPLVWLGGAGYAWVLLELKRHRLIARQRMAWPIEPPCEPSLRGSREASRELDQRLMAVLPHQKRFWLMLLVVLVPGAVMLWNVIQPIGETRLYGRLFVGITLVVLVLSVVSFYRFVSTWQSLRRMLCLIDHSDLGRSFGRIAEVVAWDPMRAFGWQIPRFRLLAASVQKLKSIARRNELLRKDAARLDDSLERAFQQDRQGRFEQEIEARMDLAIILEKACRILLSQRGDPDVQDFFALRVVSYLRYVFAHLRSFLIASLLSGSFLLIGITMYAFEPKQSYSFGIWLALSIAVAVTLATFAQMDRNTTLSLISGSTPGKVELDATFFWNALVYGGAPLLGAAITQFPDSGRIFARLLNPLFRAMGVG